MKPFDLFVLRSRFQKFEETLEIKSVLKKGKMMVSGHFLFTVPERLWQLFPSSPSSIAANKETHLITRRVFDLNTANLICLAYTVSRTVSWSKSDLSVSHFILLSYSLFH